MVFRNIHICLQYLLYFKLFSEEAADQGARAVGPLPPPPLGVAPPLPHQEHLLHPPDLPPVLHPV